MFPFSKPLPRFVFVFLGPALCAFSSPVIDDAALEEKFAQGLNEPGIVGLSGEQSTKAVEEADGKKASLGKNTGPSPSADYADASRAVVVIGPDGNVKHTELVPEIAQEPDYDAALRAL